jgi:predicted kinase
MQAVIFIGVPGSGKSTFFRQQFFRTHVRISKDLLRTRNREQVFLRACLETGQRFAIDNTNVLPEERALYIPQAREAKFRVVGYLFITELRDALRRNAQRSPAEMIPAKGVVSKFRKLVKPSLAEGFDELFSVTINPERHFLVQPWTPEPPAFPPDPSGSGPR